MVIEKKPSTKTSAQRRKVNLMKKDPHCFYCKREVFIFKHQSRVAFPDNQATLDHVEDRVYRENRPIKGINTVLCCTKCNRDRNRYRQICPEAEAVWKKSLRPTPKWKILLIKLLFKII